MTQEQRAEFTSLAGLIFDKSGKRVVQGKDQLAMLVTDMVRASDTEAFDYETVLQEVALQLINPDFSTRLSKFAQANAPELFSNMLHFFRYLESECEEYLDYTSVEQYPLSITPSNLENIRSKYSA